MEVIHHVTPLIVPTDVQPKENMRIVQMSEINLHLLSRWHYFPETVGWVHWWTFFPLNNVSDQSLLDIHELKMMKWDKIGIFSTNLEDKVMFRFRFCSNVS